MKTLLKIFACLLLFHFSSCAQEVIGRNVKLIDSGVATAKVVKNEIHKLKLETDYKDHPNLDLFVSDIPKKFQEVAELFLGKTVKNAVKVDLEEWVS